MSLYPDGINVEGGGYHEDEAPLCYNCRGCGGDLPDEWYESGPHEKERITDPAGNTYEEGYWVCPHCDEAYDGAEMRVW